MGGLALSPQEEPRESDGCSCGSSAKQMFVVAKIVRAAAPMTVKLFLFYVSTGNFPHPLFQWWGEGGGGMKLLHD